MRPILILLAIALLPACGGDDAGPAPPSPQPPRTIQIEDELANDHGVASVSGAETIAIEAGDFYFEPTIITGPPGAELQVELTSDGTHNFSMPEQGLDEDVGPGATSTFALSLPESGTLRFFCSYHRDRRMLGALQV